MAWGLYKDGVLYDMDGGFYTAKLTVNKTPSGDPILPSRSCVIILDLDNGAETPKPIAVKAKPNSSGIFVEQVAEAKGFLPQIDGETCQSTCIVNAFGGTKDDIRSIRSRLVAMPGGAGDPYNMGVILKEKFGDRYIFDDNACLSECREWLKSGELLITHGWFTGSGHVIILDGITIDPRTLGYKISVKDPWSEFNFLAWAYDNPSINRFDGDYSSHGLYAAIVASTGVSDAISIYQRRELDSMRKGAWIHRVLPSKKA
jgi:hypothetical protein